MVPMRNNRKNRLSSKSAPKKQDSFSDKKTPKKPKETATADESASEVVSDKNMTQVEKGSDAKESAPSPAVKKPCTWLKLDRLDPQVGGKSSSQNSKQGKEAKVRDQTQAVTDNMRKRKGKGEERDNDHPNSSEGHTDLRSERKGKGIDNSKHEGSRKRDGRSEKTLGGLIFMCNAKTKADCFNYQLMGIPAGKKEVVMNIKPGLNLFLYDYDLKLLYGIFEASSAGGMKLEPAAFGGAFPAQVRFAVVKDCLPLPESMFKKAIKDSYDEKTRKFKTELTVKQVKNLIDMFRPTPRLHPHGRPVGQEGSNPVFGPAPVAPLLSDETIKGQRYPNNYGFTDTGRNSLPLHPENEFPDYHVFTNAAPPQEPRFITEQEYRSNGLQQGRHLLPTPASGDVSHPWVPNILDQELKQLLRNPASTSADSGVQQREVSLGNPNFPSEKEYRMYGLRGPQQMPNADAALPGMTNPEVARDAGEAICDPYDESTTSLVNRYLSMPRMTGVVAADPYPLPRREHISDANQTGDPRIHPSRALPEGERPFASYTLGEQSDLGQRPYSLNSHEPSGPPETSAPVSQRYSFTGPSLSQQR